jgi:hypothetical protein
MVSPFKTAASQLKRTNLLLRWAYRDGMGRSVTCAHLEKDHVFVGVLYTDTDVFFPKRWSWFTGYAPTIVSVGL